MLNCVTFLCLNVAVPFSGGDMKLSLNQRLRKIYL